MAINILGLSAFYHDSAACLVRDGRIIGEYVRRGSYDSAMTITLKAMEKVTNYDETGPGYLSAYGLAAAIHVQARRARLFGPGYHRSGATAGPSGLISPADDGNRV